MSAIWFIGDLHLNHEKVSLIRGFDNPSDHNISIIKKWHKQVKVDDIVYVMGDLSGGSSTGEMKALNTLFYLPGRKRLIAGNHDSISGIHRTQSPHSQLFRDVFESIQDFGRVKLNGEQVLLSHYPYISSGDGPGRGHARYEQFRLPDLGARLIHAHTHHTHPTEGSTTGRELCVSWDAWGRLVNLGDVAKWMETGEVPNHPVRP